MKLDDLNRVMTLRDNRETLLAVMSRIKGIGKLNLTLSYADPPQDLMNVVDRKWLNTMILRRCRAKVHQLEADLRAAGVRIE